MALIELNLEKPALKRTELVKESEVETAEESETESEQQEVDVEVEKVEETQGRGKTRTFIRRAAILSGTAAGLAAARKLQQKRANEGEEVQEFEEDWQTAE